MDENRNGNPPKRNDIWATRVGVSPEYSFAYRATRSIATGGALMRKRFIGTVPGKESGVREAKGLFTVESECPQFLRTVPVLPRAPRYPDKISDAAENHLADACRYGTALRFNASILDAASMGNLVQNLSAQLGAVSPWSWGLPNFAISLLFLRVSAAS
jgi:hypothetical protein